jgi:hypothetical protein
MAMCGQLHVPVTLLRYLLDRRLRLGELQIQPKDVPFEHEHNLKPYVPILKGYTNFLFNKPVCLLNY